MSPRLQAIAGAHPYLWCLGILALSTGLLWFVQPYIHADNISLCYLIVVLVCAVMAGRVPAVLSAFASFLVFKFFFVEPLFALTIANITDPLQLLSFLIAALIASTITLRARDQAAVARAQAREMSILYDVSQSISAELSFERIAPVIVEITRQLLGCPACRLSLARADGVLEVCAASGAWPASGATADAVVRAGEQTFGMLRVALGSQRTVLNNTQQQLLETLATQAALALERSRLAHSAARAEALAASDRLKSTLISAVSHDLRTPLAAISAAADELMADDVQWAGPAVLDFAQIIKDEATQLYHVVSNLLDLTRIEAGVLQPQRGWYNVAEIIYHVLQRLAPRLELRPMDVRLPDDLPLIPVDYIQLEQVLWNVLQNALIYTPAATPILIAAEVQPGTLELQVGDRGPGIPAGEHARVFEKFYRLPHAHPASLQGAGVGLAICKGLIEAHGGTIALRDRVGGGTLVRIRLPLNADIPHKEGLPWQHRTS